MQSLKAPGLEGFEAYCTQWLRYRTRPFGPESRVGGQIRTDDLPHNVLSLFSGSECL